LIERDGCVQAHRVAEIGGHAFRHNSGTAVDQGLLVAAFDREERVHAAVCFREEQQVEGTTRR